MYASKLFIHDVDIQSESQLLTERLARSTWDTGMITTSNFTFMSCSFFFAILNVRCCAEHKASKEEVTQDKTYGGCDQNFATRSDTFG